MKIALDADGVLFDFDKSWRMCAERVLSRTLPIVTSQYDLAARYGLTKAEVHKVWAVWNDTSGWYRVHPLESGIGAARMALDLGHEVFVVSRLPSEQAAKERRFALDRWGLDRASLIPVFGASKRQALMDLRPHFYADDCAVHCLEARDALVPEIVRIRAWGPEALPDGICEFPDLSTAMREFLRKNWHHPLSLR
jgi:hypothetical protein